MDGTSLIKTTSPRRSIEMYSRDQPPSFRIWTPQLIYWMKPLSQMNKVSPTNCRFPKYSYLSRIGSTYSSCGISCLMTESGGE